MGGNYKEGARKHLLSARATQQWDQLPCPAVGSPPPRLPGRGWGGPLSGRYLHYRQWVGPGDLQGPS